MKLTFHGGLMSRSRAFNRSNRITAKRRRVALRQSVPGLKEPIHGSQNDIDHSHDLKEKAKAKVDLIDLNETL